RYHLFKVARLPGAVERGLLRAVDAEVAEPTLPGVRLDPLALLARWGVRPEVESNRVLPRPCPSARTGSAALPCPGRSEPGCGSRHRTPSPTRTACQGPAAALSGGRSCRRRGTRPALSRSPSQ